MDMTAGPADPHPRSAEGGHDDAPVLPDHPSAAARPVRPVPVPGDDPGALPDPSVRVDGPVEGIAALRRAVDEASPAGVVRAVVLRVATTRGTVAAGVQDCAEVVVDADGNLTAMSLLGALREDRVSARRVTAAMDTVGAWLDAHGCAGRDVTEVVLDADGASEVRVAFGVEITPEEMSGSPRHPAVHDATYQLSHRAPDVEALRDRLRERRTPRLRRLLHRLRLVITRSE